MLIPSKVSIAEPAQLNMADRSTLADCPWDRIAVEVRMDISCRRR